MGGSDDEFGDENSGDVNDKHLDSQASNNFRDRKLRGNNNGGKKQNQFTDPFANALVLDRPARPERSNPPNNDSAGPSGGKS